MPRLYLGHAFLLASLALGALASWWLGAPARPIAPPAGSPATVPAVPAAAHSVHVDVAGWYQATPEEAVATCAYDLRRAALPASLPLTLGDWTGAELGTDADIERWFDGPDLVIRRRYQDASERVVWLTVIGSQGAKSFRIFEHTPHSCYPSADWTAEQDDIHHVALGRGALPVRRGAFVHGDAREVVYYWYQWDGPVRDAAVGVTSWRIATDGRAGQAAAEAVLAEIVNSLFGETLPWHRF